MKKYEFTEETKVYGSLVLHRIKALIDFGNVKAGAIGGFIEKESNLSHNDKCWVYGNAEVCGSAEVYGSAEVCGSAVVYGNAEVYGSAKVYGNAKVCGSAKVYGNAKVCGSAEVLKNEHFCVIGQIGSRNAYTTFYRNTDNRISVSCGCFNGTFDEFLKKVEETHGESRYAIVYKAAVEFAKISIDLSEEDADED